MPQSRWSLLVIPLVAAALSGATCTKGATEAPKPTPSAAPAAPAPAQPSAEAQGGSGGASARNVLTGIPGMDFSSLPESAKTELANVLTDEFCYCGCPHTIGACLKTHTGCKHARRMTLLAAGEVAVGAPAVEVINSLSKYYQSFSKGRAGFKADERMCLGPKDAKITMVEFSDFECPHCLAAVPVVEGAAKGGKARVCWQPFPLLFPNSQLTAQAALFARDAGKFWQVHDGLFEQQAAMSPEVINQVLTKAGLSPAEFKKAVASNKYAAEINASKESGKSAGVDATPSLFIEGRKFNLPLTQDLLNHSVDDELEWQANKGAWAAD